jgi:hypothetical protein
VLLGGGGRVVSIVDLLTAYSHTAQAYDLPFRAMVALTGPYPAQNRAGARGRVLDRLTERISADLITAYREGTTAASPLTMA